MNFNLGLDKQLTYEYGKEFQSSQDDIYIPN